MDCPICQSPLSGCHIGEFCSNPECRWVDGHDMNDPPGKPEGHCPHGRWNSTVKQYGCYQCDAGTLISRITDYLTAGGLFNPEQMEHDKVRQLLIDCREALK